MKWSFGEVIHLFYGQNEDVSPNTVTHMLFVMYLLAMPQGGIYDQYTAAHTTYPMVICTIITVTVQYV